MSADAGPGGRVLGVLVTHRRPRELARVLKELAGQLRPLDALVVVDNAPSSESRAAVQAHEGSGLRVTYLAAPENLGPAGGIAFGMERLLQGAQDEDWIVTFDDDDPPRSNTLIDDLERLAEEMRGRDPRTAMVGALGARFDWRRGRLTRLPDSELRGPVPVDYIGGNHFPFVRAASVRQVGPFRADLFFGLDDLEFGLRLRATGHSIYVDGERVLAQRERWGRLGLERKPAVRIGDLSWRRYYSLRNAIFILRHHGRRGTALRVTLVNGFLKPLANLVRSPRSALRHLALNWRACRDGWTDRMGRTIEPEPLPHGNSSGGRLESVSP